MQINYKSDFKIHLPLTDVAGGSIPFPDYDFRIELTTTKRDRVFTASSVDGELTNCADDNGRILVVADSHGLPPGRLHCRFTAYIPDPAFPDGINEQIQETDLDIWLVPGIADIPAQISAEMQLPVVKGKEKKRARIDPDRAARPILCRGDLPAFAQSGYAYRVHHFTVAEDGDTYAVFNFVPNKASDKKGFNFGRLFPGGKRVNEGRDILFRFAREDNPERITIDREAGFIYGLESSNTAHNYFEILVPDIDSKTVTVDRKGRLIPVAGYTTRPLIPATSEYFRSYIPVPLSDIAEETGFPRRDLNEYLNKGLRRDQNFQIQSLCHSRLRGIESAIIDESGRRIRSLYSSDKHYWAPKKKGAKFYRARIVRGNNVPASEWAYYVLVRYVNNDGGHPSNWGAYKRIKEE